jgi:hypothetical protein
MTASGAKAAVKRNGHLVTDHERAEMELARTDKKRPKSLSVCVGGRGARREHSRNERLWNDRFWQTLLQEPKIGQHREFCESRFLDFSVAATLCSSASGP